MIYELVVCAKSDIINEEDFKHVMIDLYGGILDNLPFYMGRKRIEPEVYRSVEKKGPLTNYRFSGTAFRILAGLFGCAMRFQGRGLEGDQLSEYVDDSRRKERDLGFLEDISEWFWKQTMIRLKLKSKPNEKPNEYRKNNLLVS